MNKLATTLAAISVAAAAQALTIQELIDKIPSDNKEWVTITVPDGTYEGFTLVPKDKPFIRLVAKHEGRVIMTTPHSVYTHAEAGLPECVALKVDASDFEAVGITFRNTASDEDFAAGGRGKGQALAVKLCGDRGIYRRCRFIGHQDTVMTPPNGARMYFEDCYFEGTVDYIFGSATCLFNRCHCHNVGGGYVTAASTEKDTAFGYVFLDSVVTADWRRKNKHGDSERTALGRPWRPYAHTVFVNCWLGDGVAPDGWNFWGKEENKKTARYGEYNCKGPGAAQYHKDTRVDWADYDAANWKKYLADHGCKDEFDILKGSDNWQPETRR